MVKKLAIVGPQEDKWTDELKVKAKEYIENLIKETRDDDGRLILISGHCPKGGVDIWAEEVADKLGLDKQIFKPDVEQWEDDYPTEAENPYLPIRMKIGYKSRNIGIATNCDILYCIVPNDKVGFNVIPYNKKCYCRHCQEWGHPTNGGCWTLKYAKNIKKPVNLVVIK